jgi:hypothetical protein
MMLTILMLHDYTLRQVKRILVHFPASPFRLVLNGVVLVGGGSSPVTCAAAPRSGFRTLRQPSPRSLGLMTLLYVFGDVMKKNFCQAWATSGN